MEALLRMLEVFAGVAPIALGLGGWIYKRGLTTQKSIDKINDIASRVHSLESNLQDAESDIQKVSTGLAGAASTVGSGLRPVIEAARAAFDAQVSQLHEKLNRIVTELTERGNNDNKSVLLLIGTLRTDVDVIKAQYGVLFDSLSSIEVSVGTALRDAEGSRIRLHSLEDWRTKAETNLRDIDCALSTLQERTKDTRRS